MSSHSKNSVLSYRERHGGVIGVNCKTPIKDESILRVVYTPGVAEPCLKIAEDPVNSFKYTCRGNTVAIVTDGSRVMGLGDLGPEAALPVMEGKSVIFKTFAGIDAFPVCINASSTEDFINTVLALAPTFGAVCLEDIAAPKAFTIQHHLREALRISVFHNDQHAAAIEVLAGLINSVKIVGKEFGALKVVVCGAGSAGIAVSNILLQAGIKDLLICDTRGIVSRRRLAGMNWAKAAIARKTNPSDLRGSLEDAVQGADVLIGLSSGGVFSSSLIESMAKDSIVFALSVPVPEITPDEARRCGARVVATGRSDYQNQLDTALVFPGFFRGLLDTAAGEVNFEMLKAAATTLASLVPEAELSEERIVPQIFDYKVAPAIAESVAGMAVKTGVSNISIKPGEVRERLEHYLFEGRFPLPNRKIKRGMSTGELSLDLHERHRGIIEIENKIPIRDTKILSDFYLPPLAALPPEEISKDKARVYDLTCKKNLVAVVSDGSAVLGLGNIGPWAALPVMEGKCALFHSLAGVEAFPFCIATQEPEEIVQVIKNISPVLGGINLEDISAPRCFLIEEILKEELDIPVFHDDQHGTAVVVLGALINALKLEKKEIGKIRVVVSGAGAAAIAITKLLISRGVVDLTLCDRSGAIFQGREKGMNPVKVEMAKITNPSNIQGSLSAVMKGCDVFIGVSAPGLLKPEDIASMNNKSIIFSLANPTPEIMPDIAKREGGFIVATGRSDFPNQVNNSLVFPGIFRGALDARVSDINDEMKIAAAEALAGLVHGGDLGCDHIIPKGLDYRVPPVIAEAVAQAAVNSGVAGIKVERGFVRERTERFIYEGDLG